MKLLPHRLALLGLTIVFAGASLLGNDAAGSTANQPSINEITADANNAPTSSEENTASAEPLPETLSEAEGAEGISHEEDKATTVDLHTACFLIGGVTFVIWLFALVNYEDDDIRRYAWELISMVGAIFVGVMVFASVNEWVLHFAADHSPQVICGVQYLHLLFWICCLQLTLAIASGSIGEGEDHNLELEQWVIADALRADHGTHVLNQFGEYDESVVRNRTGTKSVMKIKGIEIPVEKKKMRLEQRHRRMKCWSTLLAHMTAFAAINTGGTMQHLELFASTPLLSLVPLVANQLFINLLFMLFEAGRAFQQQSRIAMGKKGVRATMFDNFASDAEIDISGLAGSFVLVQSIRFHQVGRLPNMEGEIPNTPESCVWALYSTALALVICSVIFITINSRFEFDEESYVARLLRTCAGLSGMGFGWCCLFGSRTLFLNMSELDARGIGMVTISGRVLLALMLSFIATISIFGLDYLGDIIRRVSPPGKSPGNEIIAQLVFAQCIVVGFSWEHSFDGGVAVISSKTSYPLCTKSALAGFMFLVVVPSWRRHILRKALILADYRARQQAADLEVANGYVAVPTSPRSGYTSTAITQPSSPRTTQDTALAAMYQNNKLPLGPFGQPDIPLGSGPVKVATQ